MFIMLITINKYNHMIIIKGCGHPIFLHPLLQILATPLTVVILKGVVTLPEVTVERPRLFLINLRRRSVFAKTKAKIEGCLSYIHFIAFNTL